MTHETTKNAKSPDSLTRSRKTKQPKKPGQPRKKSAKKRNEAHARVGALIAARAISDRTTSRMGLDCLVRTWIDYRLLLVEPDLQDMMWVQYRYMSPLERTELFTREYVAAYRRAFARHCGSAADASKKRPCELDFFRNDIGDMNCLWKARITADALGVPYDMYLDVVMAGKLGNGKWIEPPLPNQLYGRVDPARLRDRPTTAEINERLYGTDWDARFFADAYRGDPVQEAALQLLRVDVRDAQDPASRLAYYLADRRAITEARARAMFGDELVDAAIGAGGRPTDPVAQDTQPYLPPCFGFTKVAEESPCVVCPHFDSCFDHFEDVQHALMATAGSTNPRLHRQRAQAAARQRAWYARRKREPMDDAGD